MKVMRDTLLAFVFVTSLCWSLASSDLHGHHKTPVTSKQMTSAVTWEGERLELFDGCVWYDVSAGGTIDLSSLANTDRSARFLDVRDQKNAFLYSYNPCLAFDEGTCTNAYVCQATLTKDEYYQAGAYSNGVQITQDTQRRTMLHYQATTLGLTRHSYVTLICDKNAHSPKFVAIGDTSYAEYHMELTTVCACADGCSGKDPHITVTISIDISIGWILSIGCLAVVFVYFMAGMVYNRVRYHRTGSELLPNVSFWRVLPGLIKDGCLFTKSKVMGCTGSKRSTYQKI